MAYKFKFNNLESIPKTNINMGNLRQIFAIVQTGSKQQIINSFIERDLGANLIDETNNQTLLHAVLLNDDLSRADQVEIAKLLISNGAQVGLYDNNNESSNNNRFKARSI